MLTMSTHSLVSLSNQDKSAESIQMNGTLNGVVSIIKVVLQFGIMVVIVLSCVTVQG